YRVLVSVPLLELVLRWIFYDAPSFLRGLRRLLPWVLATLCRRGFKPCVRGSPSLATRPLLPQSPAASSHSHATAPSGCVGAVRPVSSTVAQFSAVAPRLGCI